MESAEGGPERADGGAWGRARLIGIPLVVYSLLSVLPLWSIGIFDSKRSALCGCEDTIKESYFLSWTAHALVHGLNPFFAGVENVPYGVNLAADASTPILGLITAPISLAFGPISAFNFLLRVGFAGSAWAMYLVLRHWKVWWPAAFIAGLFYGFSPYVTGQTTSHLNLSFVPLPPIIIAVLYEIVVGNRHGSRFLGLLLGGLLAAQYLISSEILADLGIVVVIGVITLTIRHPGEVRLRARRVLASMGWAVLVVVVICGYPILFMQFGAQHLTGPPQTVTGLGDYRLDLLGVVFPTTNELFGPSSWMATGSTFVQNSVVENGSYLGIPFLVLLAAIVVYARKNATVLMTAWLGFVAWVFSLGRSLNIDNHLTGIPLPFAILEHIPLLQIEVPARYGLEMDLFFSVTLALGMQTFWLRTKDRSKTDRAQSHVFRLTRRLIGGSAVLAVALFPLVPRWPIPEGSTRVPSYFTTNDVKNIPKGSVVLTYPYPYAVQDYAMLWQADSGFRFSIIGDYGNTPQKTGTVDGAAPGGGIYPPTLDPPFVQIIFEDGFYGLAAGQKFTARSQVFYDAFQQFFTKYEVGTIILDPIGSDPKDVERFIAGALGEPPVHAGGVDVWYDVASAVARQQPKTASP